eukprot:COSAG02_NODE_2415_length_8913_cov_2.989676_2_plen_150_part_00
MVLRCVRARAGSEDEESSDLTNAKPAPIVLAPAPAPGPAPVPTPAPATQRVRLSQTRNAVSSDQARPSEKQHTLARNMVRSADRMALSADRTVCESLTCYLRCVLPQAVRKSLWASHACHAVACLATFASASVNRSQVVVAVWMRTVLP